MKRIAVPMLCLLVLGGCGAAQEESNAQALIERVEPHPSEDAPQNSFGFMESMEQGPDPFGQQGPTARQSVVATIARSNAAESEAQLRAPMDAEQQIAYSYGFGFQIAGESIAALQKRHVKMCEALSASCRVMRISQATSDGWDGYGELELQVDSERAVTFGGSLADPAKELGGELISSVRDGEDLTEQIIDSEARLQSRLLLRDKLTTILRNNSGSVDELVKAEKAVADVNEELDATRSKLQQLRNRIRYSAVRIEYQPYYGETQMGFVRPVMTALRSIRTTLGMTVALIVYLLTALVPITLFVLALRWILHRFGLRLRFWRKGSTETGSSAGVAATEV